MLHNGSLFPAEAMSAIVELGLVGYVVQYYRKRQSKLKLRIQYSKSVSRRLDATEELFTLISETDKNMKAAQRNRSNRLF